MEINMNNFDFNKVNNQTFGSSSPLENLKDTVARQKKFTENFPAETKSLISSIKP